MKCSPESGLGRGVASNSHCELAIHPAGTVLEGDHGRDGEIVKRASGVQFAVHRGDKDRSLEMRLPITGEGSRMIDPLKGIDCAVPKDLFPWHFDFCRQHVRCTSIERTAFSARGKDDFHVPE